MFHLATRWFYKPTYKLSLSFKPLKDFENIQKGNSELVTRPVGSCLIGLRGYYMLEASCSNLAKVNGLSIQLATDDGNFICLGYLRLKSNKTSKRIIYFEDQVKNLQILSDSDFEGEIELQLKFIPLNTAFSKKLVLKKLNANLNYAGKSLNHLSFDVLWHEYQQLFNKLCNTNYASWIEGAENKIWASKTTYSDIKFSIVVPVFNSKPKWLEQLLQSVIEQTYTNWQLILVDDASINRDTLNYLKSIDRIDERVQIFFRTQNGHICQATNDGIKQVSGDFVLFLDHDDLLSPNALNELVTELTKYPQTKLIYSDEDLMTENGVRVTPHFKPDWNLDLLLSHNYITHLACYDRGFINELGGMRLGYEGAQDYDLALRASKTLKPNEILHIPKILYHWRMVEGSTASDASNKSYATHAGLRAVQDYLDSTGANAQACHDSRDNFYKIKWPLPSLDSTPVVSIIIPTRNGLDVLKPCIDSLINTTQYPKLELVIVDNGTDDLETLAYLKYLNNEYSIKSQTKPFMVKVVEDQGDFNFSRLINAGAKAASGAVLLLLNNDTQAIEAGWLQEMLSHTLRKDIGCVGAKLLYPDETIQHAGVIMGLGGYAAHSHRGIPRYAAGYFCRAQVVQNLSAVTAACLMVRRDVFDQVNGFDESFAVAYNDVDFCLRVRAAGYRNLYTPFAELFHHESKTRGEDICANKQARFNKEKSQLLARWQSVIEHDPAYNPNLTRSNEEFSIGSL